MSNWDGLPDFGAPIAGGPGPIFAGCNTSIARAMPVQVVVAALKDGLPDFRVDLTRSSIASKPPWGALHLRVARQCDIDACLAAVRAQLPGFSVAPAQPSGGFARLVSAGGPSVPADLGVVRSFDWTNLAAAQLVVPDLSRDGSTSRCLPDPVAPGPSNRGSVRVFPNCRAHRGIVRSNAT